MDGRVYTVKGINPTGKLVEIRVLAATLEEEKRAAVDVGLRHVLVAEVPWPEDGAGGKRGGGGRGGSG